MRLRTLLVILIVSFFAPSCVEHLITIRVYPDSRYLMNFVSRGDSTDVFNEDFPHPFGDPWVTKIETEISDDSSDLVSNPRFLCVSGLSASVLKLVISV